MAGNGFERRGMRTERGEGRKEPCGEEDTRKALIITLFCCSAGKIKICGEEKVVLQEQHISIITCYSKLPVLLPDVQSVHGTVSRIHSSGLPCGRTLRKKGLRHARHRYRV